MQSSARSPHLTKKLFHPGSELRSWILFYSLPVLFGILPEPYFMHYALLFASVHVLMSDCLTTHRLQLSKYRLETGCESLRGFRN